LAKPSVATSLRPIPLKDPDTENLDAGWDDAPSEPPLAASLSAPPPAELDDVDAGWDDAPSDAPPSLPPAPAPVVRAPAAKRAKQQPAAVAKPEPAPRANAARPGRMSKRERRAFERQKRVESEKRRSTRRADEKRERQEEARRAAAQREAERREAQERAERSRRAEKKRTKRRAESRPEESERDEGSVRETPPKNKQRERRRFAMPNGGWIVFVIGLITLGTAWFAFGR